MHVNTIMKSCKQKKIGNGKVEVLLSSFKKRKKKKGKKTTIFLRYSNLRYLNALDKFFFNLRIRNIMLTPILRILNISRIDFCKCKF